MEISQFDEFNIEQAKKYAKEIAGENFDRMETVLENAINHPEALPNLFRKQKPPYIFKDYISKWVNKFVNGYNNRPSVRAGGKSQTIPDPLIFEVLKAFLGDKASAEAIQTMTVGHALMMRIENLMGDFLEEYLAERLYKYNWRCCWGTTIGAVDFCNDKGVLLQIKNSDNSENSSSSAIRAGTKIIKWYRRNSKKENSFNWEELNTDLNITELSEADYRKFVTDKIKANPGCLMID